MVLFTAAFKKTLVVGMAVYTEFTEIDKTRNESSIVKQPQTSLVKQTKTI